MHLISSLLTFLQVIEAGVVPLAINRLSPRTPQAHPLHKRINDGTLDMDMYSDRSIYAAIVEIDGQELIMHLDTGSSDFWVMSSSNPMCSTPTQSTDDADSTLDCALHGTLEDTSAVEFDGQDFFISYVDGEWAEGEYGYVDVTLMSEGITVEDVYLAVANASTSNTQILGIGFKENSATPHENLPYLLKKQEFISKVMYSMYMDDETNEGSLLFGGIDHAKYEGELQTFPVINDTEIDVNSFLIQIDSVGVEGAEWSMETNETEIYAVIDSGTTNCQFPVDVVDYLVETLGLGEGEELNFGKIYPVTCDNSTFDVNITFTLGELVVSVPLGDLIERQEGECGLHLSSPEKENTTMTYIFGDFFMKRVYTVYDLEDKELQMALYKSSQESDIEAVCDTECSYSSHSVDTTAIASASAIKSSKLAEVAASTATAAGLSSNVSSGATSSSSVESTSTDGAVTVASLGCVLYFVALFLV